MLCGGTGVPSAQHGTGFSGISALATESRQGVMTSHATPHPATSRMNPKIAASNVSGKHGAELCSLLFRSLCTFASRFGKADRNGLLATLHRLPALSAFESSLLSLVHRTLNRLVRTFSVSRHSVLLIYGLR